MERIEEFTHSGKNFCYIDFSDFQTVKEFTDQIETAMPIVSKYAESSLYTITNVKNIKFDTPIKDVLTKWMEHNKPYVKYGAICGVDGIKKIMLGSMLKWSGRKNMACIFTREAAMDWLVKQG